MRMLTKIVRNVTYELISFVRKNLTYMNIILSGLVVILLMMQSKYPEQNYDKVYRMALVTFVLLSIARVLYDALYKLSQMNSRYEYREYLVKELESNETTSEISQDTKQDEVEIKSNDDTKAVTKANCIENDKNEQRIKKDIIALMLKNNDEITEYFKISKKQAKSSYRFSIFSCIAGIAMIGIAI